MKKLFLFLLCTSISLSFSFGQTSKNTKFWMVNLGTFGNSSKSTHSSNSPTISQSNRTDSNNSFFVALSMGKFFKDNVAHGFRINYSNVSSHVTNNSVNNNYKEFNGNQDNVELGYFITRFIPVNSQFYFYGNLNPNVYYSYHTSKYDNLEAEKQRGYNISIKADVGMRYIFKNNFFIDTNTSLGRIGYFWANIKDVSETSGLELYSESLFSNFSIGIGKSF